MNDMQAEKFEQVVAAVAEQLGKPEMAAEIAAWLSDETDADNVAALAANFCEYIKREIADGLGDDDVQAWHASESTETIEALVRRVGTFEVWGSRTGPEPLSIVWPA